MDQKKSMLEAVIALGKLGPLPPSDVAINARLEELVDRYAKLLASIQKPVTDEEARVLVTLFGPDECFGVAWSLLHLIETAPGWPLEDCLKDTDNEWVLRLRRGLDNAKHRRTQQ
jgi:hypothetical protein